MVQAIKLRPLSLGKCSGSRSLCMQTSVFMTTRNEIEKNGFVVRRIASLRRMEPRVALACLIRGGLTFWTNGKSDGNAFSTRIHKVMSGLIGVILHPKATKPLVLRLGTGSTAGWARRRSIHGARWTSSNLEDAVLKVENLCPALNRNASRIQRSIARALRPRRLYRIMRKVIAAFERDIPWIVSFSRFV
jgi:hypothetical protein